MTAERILKSIEFKAANVDMEARTFEGYAATWDRDQVGDVIMPGAFAKTIAERFPKGDIKILYNHWEAIGIRLEMREDEKGLWVKGKISKTTLGDDVLELMRDGVVNLHSLFQYIFHFPFYSTSAYHPAPQSSLLSHLLETVT